MLEFMSIPPPSFSTSTSTPSLFILYFLSPLPFHSTHDKGNLTEAGCRSSQVWKLFAATHCPRSLASSTRPPPSPPLSLFSPLFIIIRFYRASRPETTIKRVGTLCSFDSVGGQFARRRFHPPLSSTLFSLFARAYRTPSS